MTEPLDIYRDEFAQALAARREYVYPPQATAYSSFAGVQYPQPLAIESAPSDFEGGKPTSSVVFYDVALPADSQEVGEGPNGTLRQNLEDIFSQGDNSDSRSNRRRGLVAAGLTFVLLGAGGAAFVSCVNNGKDVVATASELQNDYQHMPTEQSTAKPVTPNPLLPPMQLPSVDLSKQPPVDPFAPPVAPTTSAAIPESMLKCVNTWSLERRVARLIIAPVKADGSYALRSQASLRTTMRIIRDYHLGGIVITQGTPAQAQAIKAAYTAKGVFDSPLLIGEVQKDEWYGFHGPYLSTSVDMGAPAAPGDTQLPIADVFAKEVADGKTVPVYLQDAFTGGREPLTLAEQALAMRDTGVQRVQRGAISVDVLNSSVVQSYLAAGGDTCAVKIG